MIALFFFEKTGFFLGGNFLFSGSTAKNRVRFDHFWVKLDGVKFKIIFKNAYFLPIFTTNHGIYLDSWILWNLNEFKRNLLGIYRLFSIDRVYGMYGMFSALYLKCFQLCKRKIPYALLSFLKFPNSTPQIPFNFFSLFFQKSLDENLNYVVSLCKVI